MAVTKILARKGRLDVGINYVLNGDKTQERVLTARLNCDPGRECRQMLDTKRAYGKEDGVMYYHIIQSFKPGEITPELALEIAKEFAQEHLAGYETVIGVHVDKEHIHAHLVFNSVNADTGEKYHSEHGRIPGPHRGRAGQFDEAADDPQCAKKEAEETV